MAKASIMASSNQQSDSFGEFLKVTQGRVETEAPQHLPEPADAETIAELLKAASHGPITVPDAMRETHMSVLDLAKTLEHITAGGFVSVRGSGENEVIELTEFGTEFLKRLAD